MTEAVTVALIAGIPATLGVILSIINMAVARHDKKHDAKDTVLKSIDEINQKIDKLSDIGDKRNATSMRVRILRFRDELLEGQEHTHDSFQQVLSDIDEYESYCESHPEFKNNQTAATVEHIKRIYAERLAKHDFA